MKGNDMNTETFLKERGVAFTVHEHIPAYTAQEVAAEEHVSGNMLAKAVVINADGKFVLCVLPASFKLDMDKVARALKAKRIRLADEQEMAKLFPDCEVGAEAPFGNLYNMPTLVDEHLSKDQEIVFQADSHRQAIRMRYADYAAIAHPELADVAMHL